MSRPTIQDVARKAGVGVGTVSRVINNSPKVSPATRERVLAAIQSLGFKPNTAARQLSRKSRVHNIGVITQPFLAYHSFVERLRGVQRVLTAVDSDYEMILFNVSSAESYAQRLNSIVQGGLVDGLLIIDLDLSAEQQNMLKLAHIPAVGLNQFQGRTWPCIGIDNYMGASLAAEHLVALGHTHIAYIGDEFVERHGFVTSGQRFNALQQILAVHDLTVHEDDVYLGPHGFEPARDLARRLVAKPNKPTAIFAMSDMQALGAIAAIRESGLRVPEDISVIGYDDLELSTHTGLTTVRHHLELGGQLGVEYLLQLLAGEQTAPVPELPLPEVIVRQTTRPVVGTAVRR